MLLKPQVDIVRAKDGNLGSFFHHHTEATLPEAGKETVYTIPDGDAGAIMLSTMANVSGLSDQFPTLTVERVTRVPMHLLRTDPAEPMSLCLFTSWAHSHAMEAAAANKAHKLLLGTDSPMSPVIPMPSDYKLIGSAVSFPPKGVDPMSQCPLYVTEHGEAMVYIGLPFELVTGETVFAKVIERLTGASKVQPSFLLHPCPTTEEHYAHYKEKYNGRLFNLADNESAVMLGALTVSVTTPGQYRFMSFDALQAQAHAQSLTDEQASRAFRQAFAVH